MIYLATLEYRDIENYEAGGHLRDSSRNKSNDDFDMEGRDSKDRIVNISSDIILKISELLYVRTRFKSDLPTEEILLENMLEFIPIFLNNVIECQVLTESPERLEN